MSYLIFNLDLQFYDTDGNPCSLYRHLRDIDTWMDSPQHWSSCKSLYEAMQLARQQHFATAIVDIMDPTHIIDEHIPEEHANTN